ncbi:hypothetical protein B0T25DRAFT_462267 [Lasiosphaeria hispida]|uniref:2EXR domain-containing protein n=1 Tax=Lasiosphaeria hispida TaxID=260671 RepID=A0AAJ0HD60_9PEZI|nr:hypothetical protein B0T25DRAFT_462267 [Lasiosphaeria hispida]
MSNNSFTPFSRLPAELRVRIWQDALSAPSVFAMLRNRKYIQHCKSIYHVLRNKRLAYTMAFATPAPYPAGLSCMEARQLLEKSHIPLQDAYRPGPVCWIDQENTVIFLGDCFDGIATLQRLNPRHFSQLKHMAMVWQRMQPGFVYSRVFKLLAELCPVLRTLIIHDGKRDGNTNVSVSTAQTAAYLEILAAQAGPGLGYVGPEGDGIGNLKSWWERAFHAWDVPPNLHVLPAVE